MEFDEKLNGIKYLLDKIAFMFLKVLLKDIKDSRDIKNVKKSFIVLKVLCFTHARARAYIYSCF